MKKKPYLLYFADPSRHMNWHLSTVKKSHKTATNKNFEKQIKVLLDNTVTKIILKESKNKKNALFSHIPGSIMPKN